MATITTRAGKGSPLTNTEVDNNFTNLNTAKYESGNNVSFGSGSFTGSVNISGSSSDTSRYIQIGTGMTAGYAYIDLVGDSTYTDYGLRLIRENSGANAASSLTHRGTGNFYLNAPEGSNQIIMNEAGANTDFRVETDNHAHALFVDASTDRVGVRTSSPLYHLHVVGSTYTSSFHTNTNFNYDVGYTSGGGTHYIGNLRHNGGTDGYMHIIVESSIDHGQQVPGTLDVVIKQRGGTVKGYARRTGRFQNNNDVRVKAVSTDANSSNIELWLEVDDYLQAMVRTRHKAGGNWKTAQTAASSTAVSTLWNSDDYMIMLQDDTHTTINESGANHDFRVESDTNSNALFLDASSNEFGFSTNNPDAVVGIQQGASGNQAVALRLRSSTNEQDVVMRFTGKDGNSATRYADIIFDADGGNERLQFKAPYNTSSPQLELSSTYGAVFNEGGVNRDFRVESDNNSHMLFVDAGNDAVGIGGSPITSSQLTIDASSDANQVIQADNKLTFVQDSYWNSLILGGAYWNGQAKHAVSNRSVTRLHLGHDSNSSPGTQGLQVHASSQGAANANVTFEHLFSTTRAGTVFNDDGNDRDFRVESDANSTMFQVDAGSNVVGVGSTNTNAQFNVAESMQHGKLWSSKLYTVSVPYSDFTAGGQTWVKVAEFDNPCYVDVIYYVGTNNGEERGKITFKGTYHGDKRSPLTWDRGTYNRLLDRVRMSQASGGANHIMWFLIDTDSSAHGSAMSLGFQIVNYMSNNAPTIYASTGTNPPTGANSNELRAEYNDVAYDERHQPSTKFSAPIEIDATIRNAGSPDYNFIIGQNDYDNDVNQTGGSGVGMLFRPATNSVQAIGAAIEATCYSSSDDNTATRLLFKTTGNDANFHEGLRLDYDGSVIVNEQSDAGTDFRVESNNNSHMIFVDSGQDKVLINGSGTAIGALHVYGETTNGSLTGASPSNISFVVSNSDNGYGTMINQLGTGVGEIQVRRTFSEVYYGLSLSPYGGGVVINENHAASGDFRVESDNNSHMLFVDAGNNRVGIKEGNPDTELHVQGTITAGTADSTAGSTVLEANYSDHSNDNPNIIGTQYSSSKWAIGFGVRPKSGAVGYNSSVDNSNWTRGVLEVSNELHFLSAGAQTTAVGSTVSLTERFKVQSNGTTVFNEPGSNSADFRVESDTKSHMLFVDASTDRLGVGTSSPTSTLHVNGSIQTMGSIHGPGPANSGTSDVRGVMANAATEENHFMHPFLNNSWGHFIERGGSFSISNYSGGVTINPAFYATSTNVGLYNSNYTANTVDLIFTNVPYGLSYGAYGSITFGNSSWAPTSVTVYISTNNGSTWSQKYSHTGAKTNHSWYWSTGSSQTNAMKITLGRPSNNSYLRINNITAYNYVGQGTEQYHLPRRGGDLYGALTVNQNGSSSNDFRVESSSNTHALFVDAGSNRVGIGTSSPSYSVDVANSLAATVGVIKNATGDNIKLQAGGTGYSDFNITTESGGEKLLTIKDTSDVQFFGSDQSTVKMTWDASADSLGIGVTSPTQKLDVNGTVKATAFVGDGSGLTGISGGGGSTGPAFFAKKHTGGSGPPQYISLNTYTKVTFTVEDIDTDSDFTNSRFTPGTAGYYWIHVNLLCACGSGGLNTAIYKNGSSQILSVYTEEQNYSAKGTASGLVYLNGSTDYVEAYVLMSAAPGSNSNASVQLNQSSYFTGFLAR